MVKRGCWYQNFKWTASHFFERSNENHKKRTETTDCILLWSISFHAGKSPRHIHNSSCQRKLLSGAWDK